METLNLRHEPYTQVRDCLIIQRFRNNGGRTSDRSPEALLSKFTVPDFESRKWRPRITSVEYRPDGQELLVSYSSDYLYVFNPYVSKEERSLLSQLM
jgi:hypothetical protein